MFTLTHPPIGALGVAFVLLLGSAPAAAGTLTIPHTFSANTKAVAAEVNANFTAAKTAVDDNDSRIAALAARVSTLEGELTALQGQLVTVLALATLSQPRHQCHQSADGPAPDLRGRQCAHPKRFRHDR